jgi:hypothetical protein
MAATAVFSSSVIDDEAKKILWLLLPNWFCSN